MATAAYPDAPWLLRASLWLTLLALPRDADPQHPRGLWGAAFVSYREPSPLTYSELLVARLRRDPSPAPASALRPAGWHGTITDIWVDSPASLAGGRELWAIPKHLAHFTCERRDTRHVRWTARSQDGPLATATYAAVPGVGAVARRLPRLPFALTLAQPALADTVDGDHGGVAGDRQVAFTGRARMVPQRAGWAPHPQGPLSFLADARALGSVCLDDGDLRFG